MSPDQFPILRSSQTNPHRFDEAIELIATGLSAGAIRNAVLQEAKAALSRAVTDAWEKHVGNLFFHGRGDQVAEDVNELYWSIYMMGLHDVLATSKKVSKSKVQGPAVEAMRAFCAEALPLAEAVAALKAKAIKGRAPSAVTPKPENPNKTVKTCPVCFRSIAVLRGTMAHHGYKRPGHGWQSASCSGIRFQPLEVSNEGLVWLIATLRERLASLRTAYANQATHPMFLVAQRVPGGRAEKISRDDPLWPKLFTRHIAEVEQEIRYLDTDLPQLEQKLASWKPEAQS